VARRLRHLERLPPHHATAGCASLAAVAVLCFIFSWNDFFYALILTRTNAMTAPVAIINFMQYEGWEWGKMAAGGTLVMLPVIVFTVLVRKWLVSGLMAGSVKD
jgi:multiple sugar transport system permease protein